MLTIKKLNDFGANTAEGLARCASSEALYHRLVNMIPNESHFSALQSALDEGDADKAFEAVHALKGVLGNLSLTPMYQTASQLTERLRLRELDGCAPLLDELLAQKTALEALCAD